MSVIPMKLLTIAGPLEQFDPVAAACVLDREFHPENALALMERVSGLRPLSAADLYAAPLHRAEELLEAMDLSPPMPLLRTIRPGWTPSRPTSTIWPDALQNWTSSVPGSPAFWMRTGTSPGNWNTCAASLPSWSPSGICAMSASGTAGSPGRPMRASRPCWMSTRTSFHPHHSGDSPGLRHLLHHPGGA